jgi:hypothetical protein
MGREIEQLKEDITTKETQLLKQKNGNTRSINLTCVFTSNAACGLHIHGFFVMFIYPMGSCLVILLTFYSQIA